MRTAVISDLHLGARSGNAVLERPDVRRRLLDALHGVERVVLLGDVVELRERGLEEGMALALPFLEDLGEAVGGGEVVLVPGNHDHPLAEPVVAGAGDSGGLALESRVRPDPHHPLGRLAARMGRAPLELAYPGLWLADGVYATHGHYLDHHSAVPSFECVAIAAAGRMVGEVPGDGATPDDYERVAAPVYRAAAGLGQMTRPGGAALGADASVRLWGRLRPGGAGDGLPIRLLEGALPGAVAAVNRLGLGPFVPDFSTPALRRSGLRSMVEAARRLGIAADVLVFGHTHRPGPLPEDDPASWSPPDSPSLVNTGNWVYEPLLVGGEAEGSPYWPGTFLFLDGDAPPRLERLLADVADEELRTGVD